MICESCDREYEYNRKQGHTKTRCNTCVQHEQRNRKKQKMVDYLGGECSFCGYKKCLRALEFHHTNPLEKEFCMSNFSTITWERLKKELDKCILLCSNCHMELEDKIAVERKYNKK